MSASHSPGPTETTPSAASDHNGGASTPPAREQPLPLDINTSHQDTSLGAPPAVKTTTPLASSSETPLPTVIPILRLNPMELPDVAGQSPPMLDRSADTVAGPSDTWWPTPQRATPRLFVSGSTQATPIRSPQQLSIIFETSPELRSLATPLRALKQMEHAQGEMPEEPEYDPEQEELLYIFGADAGRMVDAVVALSAGLQANDDEDMPWPTGLFQPMVNLQSHTFSERSPILPDNHAMSPRLTLPPTHLIPSNVGTDIAPNDTATADLEFIITSDVNKEEDGSDVKDRTVVQLDHPAGEGAIFSIMSGTPRLSSQSFNGLDVISSAAPSVDPPPTDSAKPATDSPLDPVVKPMSPADSPHIQTTIHQPLRADASQSPEFVSTPGDQFSDELPSRGDNSTSPDVIEDLISPSEVSDEGTSMPLAHAMPDGKGTKQKRVGDDCDVIGDSVENNGYHLPTSGSFGGSNTQVIATALAHGNPQTGSPNTQPRQVEWGHSHGSPLAIAQKPVESPQPGENQLLILHQLPPIVDGSSPQFHSSPGSGAPVGSPTPTSPTKTANSVVSESPRHPFVTIVPPSEGTLSTPLSQMSLLTGDSREDRSDAMVLRSPSQGTAVLVGEASPYIPSARLSPRVPLSPIRVPIHPDNSLMVVSDHSETASQGMLSDMVHSDFTLPSRRQQEPSSPAASPPLPTWGIDIALTSEQAVAQSSIEKVAQDHNQVNTAFEDGSDSVADYSTLDAPFGPQLYVTRHKSVDGTVNEVRRRRPHPLNRNITIAHHPDFGTVVIKRERLLRRRSNLREGTVWRYLNHPHILPFLGRCRILRSMYLVSPDWGGQSMIQYLRASTSPYDPERLINEVGSAVLYMHGRGIRHGDIQAENVVIASADARALICNFESSSLGCQGSALADDVFDFGVLIAEVLTGENIRLWRSSIRIRRPRRPNAFVVFLWDIAEHCWEPSPLLRPPIHEVLGELDNKARRKNVVFVTSRDVLQTARFTPFIGSGPQPFRTHRTAIGSKPASNSSWKAISGLKTLFRRTKSSHTGRVHHLQTRFEPPTTHGFHALETTIVEPELVDGVHQRFMPSAEDVILPPDFITLSELEQSGDRAVQALEQARRADIEMASYIAMVSVPESRIGEGVTRRESSELNPTTSALNDGDRFAPTSTTAGDAVHEGGWLPARKPILRRIEDVTRSRDSLQRELGQRSTDDEEEISSRFPRASRRVTFRAHTSPIPTDRESIETTSSSSFSPQSINTKLQPVSDPTSQPSPFIPQVSGISMPRPPSSNVAQHYPIPIPLARHQQAIPPTGPVRPVRGHGESTWPYSLSLLRPYGGRTGLAFKRNNPADLSKILNFSGVWAGTLLCSDHSQNLIAVKEVQPLPNISSSMKTESAQALLKSLKREIMLLFDLDHPRILPLIGCTFQPLFLVMPWCSLGNISEYTKRFAENDKLKLIEQVASALAYLEANAVVHGNVVLTNVLINEEGDAVLTDVGVVAMQEATFPSSVRAYRDVHCDPRSMAPELIGSDAPRTWASDMYAFACLILEVLSGKLPFSETLSTDVHGAKRSGIMPGHRETHPMPDDLPFSQILDLWLLLDLCWDSDPEKRPSAGEFTFT